MDEFFNKLKRPFNGTWDAVESDMSVFEYIMIRLPVKSILMFKSISKHWYNVISTKIFMQLHYHWSKKNAKFFAFHDPIDKENNEYCEMHLMEPNGVYIESYPINPVFKTLEDINLIASFNGLICLMNDATLHEMAYNMDLRICNPATHEVLLLPRSHMSQDKPIFGVLYSNKSHIYKIFKFFSDDPKIGYSRCEVYFSKTRQWKLATGVPTHTLMQPTRSWLSNSNGVCVNEKLYWFSADGYEDGIDYSASVLMVDMEENFRLIPLPTYPETAFLIELCGRLCFVEWLGVKFCLWLYNETNDGWYLLNIVIFPFKGMEIAHFDSVVTHKDEILFVYRDLEYLRHKVMYDVRRATWTYFPIAEDDEEKKVVVFPYFETFLSCHTHMPATPEA
ncbi:hypothetical protein LXL04_037507 [Taraxacum kok-saghyz]